MALWTNLDSVPEVSESHPSLADENESRLNPLCSVHALRINVDRTKDFRKCNQLLVSWDVKGRLYPSRAVALG